MACRWFAGPAKAAVKASVCGFDTGGVVAMCASGQVRAGKSAARVTNVLVVSLDASCKKDCSHQDTETKASRRDGHAGSLPVVENATGMQRIVVA